MPVLTSSSSYSSSAAATEYSLISGKAKKPCRYPVLEMKELDALQEGKKSPNTDFRKDEFLKLSFLGCDCISDQL